MQLSPASSKLHPFTSYSSSSAELQLQEIVQGRWEFSERRERSRVFRSSLEILSKFLFYLRLRGLGTLWVVFIVLFCF